MVAKITVEEQTSENLQDMRRYELAISPDSKGGVHKSVFMTVHKSSNVLWEEIEQDVLDTLGHLCGEERAEIVRVKRPYRPGFC